MKLSLKTGEHLRIAHDSAHGRFRVYVEENTLHITAAAPGEPADFTIAEPGATPGAADAPARRLAAAG